MCAWFMRSEMNEMMVAVVTAAIDNMVTYGQWMDGGIGVVR